MKQGINGIYICPVCKKQITSSDLYPSFKKHFRYTCKTCQKLGTRNSRAKNPKKWSDYHKKYRTVHKEQWMCIIKELNMDICHSCGYNKYFGAIEFHHVEPKKKEFNICKFLGEPITERRIQELKKCIPLCSNCHRELHMNDHNTRGKF